MYLIYNKLPISPNQLNSIHPRWSTSSITHIDINNREGEEEKSVGDGMHMISRHRHLRSTQDAFETISRQSVVIEHVESASGRGQGSRWRSMDKVGC